MPRVLFAGLTNLSVAWYRCVMPATVLGADWAALAGEPDEFGVRSCSPGVDLPDFDALAGYDVVVLAQPAGKGWLHGIRELQARGVTVLFEIDDYVRGVRKVRDHAFKDSVGKERAEGLELCMRAADGVICSTAWLAERFRAFNPRVWVCRNGIDLRRYAVTRLERPWVTVGWSGATGHASALAPWLSEVAQLMRERADVRFVSVGEPFARALQDEFGAERAVAVPWTPFIETYPAPMSMFDVALAPAGRSSFFRGKSDLRWLEASALRIPTIADPVVYPDVEHGVTGFHAESAAEAAALLRALVDDRALRARVGAAAYEHVAAHRRAEVAARQWAAVFAEATGAAAAAA
jgi:glycosyltransferase involved in cell wall biosynthesis